MRRSASSASSERFLLSGRPLGFVAILGILALIGMITKNAVILLGQIESERAQGKDVRTAAIDASAARFRPIMLTAVSTVLGMIPIAPPPFSWGPDGIRHHGRPAGGDIAYADFLPTLYVTWFRPPGKAPAVTRRGENRSQEGRCSGATNAQAANAGGSASMSGIEEGRPLVAIAFLLRSAPISCSGSSLPAPIPKAFFRAHWPQSSRLGSALASCRRARLRFVPLRRRALSPSFCFHREHCRRPHGARMALHPRMPLRPGIVSYRPGWPAGPRRDAFSTLASLLPGRFPADRTTRAALPSIAATPKRRSLHSLPKRKRRLAGALRVAP